MSGASVVSVPHTPVVNSELFPGDNGNAAVMEQVLASLADIEKEEFQYSEHYDDV